MPEESKEKGKKLKGRLNLLSLLLFAILIAVIFWQVIRPKILFAGCSEIALNTSHVQSRARLIIDTTDSYQATLNECLIQAGVPFPIDQ